ncbi:hypothetical protein LT85_0159 [Collimonas arenae]|uniref:Uncharacterized protein n=1 Tax=Collimonas arenae TaxID=279058 RepID=A0A0A1F6M7_9BURK|nr:hypothetical protein LT85_0159 [Collimonas arenae]
MVDRRTGAERIVLVLPAIKGCKPHEIKGLEGWHGLCSTTGRINDDPTHSDADPMMVL